MTKARRIKRRAYLHEFSTNSYVGNEDDQEDLLCAAEHDTIGVRMVLTQATGGIYDAIAMTYLNQGSNQVEMSTMTLLIPDRDRPNQEDFIWCVPIERQKWNKWYSLSEKFHTCVPKEYGGVRYMNRMEGRDVRTILMMPNEYQSDDEAITSCAFLRMVKGLSCRIFVVRCTDDPLTGARLIHKVAGADVSLVEDVEFPEDDPSTKDILQA
jgi:hypothetical protein